MGGFGDVVVFLPGILGSELQKDGRTLWGVTPGTAWGILNGSGPLQLELHEPASLVEDIEDGIVATGLLSNIEIIPGLWKFGGYSRLPSAIIAALKLRRGENYFDFPYDWRRDIRVAAARLERESTRWLEAWRETSGNREAKLVIIGHSMGGLVARYFIECLGGWERTRTLITLGTPFRGSGSALTFLANGLKIPYAPAHIAQAFDAFRSFDSVYQLLPTYPFVTDGTGGPVHVTELQIPGVSPDRAKKALALHMAMEQAKRSNESIPAYRDRKSPFRNIVGTGQPTVQSAAVGPDGVTPNGLDTLGNDFRGDGTVPRVSATPPEEASEIEATTYIANKHAALTGVDSALNQVTGVLSREAIDLAAYRDHGSDNGIGLTVPDMAIAGSPIEVSATTRTSQTSLRATLRSLTDPGGLSALALNRQGQHYRNEMSLTAGVYEITVSGLGAEPVTDIFMVIDGKEQR